MKTEVSEPSEMQQALSSNVPAFLAKLWAMVNEESTDVVIGWTECNKSFYIRNQSVFSMELLPVYYKHNNMASFVRQLNMYGFRKVLSPMAGSLRNESDEMIFAHPDFVRNEPWGLENIKRKIPHHKDLPPSSGELVARLYTEVKSMKSKQDSLDGHLNKMKRENESLWREVLVLRQKHSKQQQIVNKLIQFLVSFVQPGRPAAASSMGLKRKKLPMLENSVGQLGGPSTKAARLSRTFSMDENVAASIGSRSVTSNSSPGPVIHDVTDQITSPPDSGVVSSSPSQLSGRPVATGLDWTPLVETLSSPSDPNGDMAPVASQWSQDERRDQPQQDTTVALPTSGDSRQETTPVLCDSLLESIQADLDGLRGLMGSPSWRMDTSSMQNILQEPNHALPGGLAAESEQQLVSYNPSLLDLFTTESDELFPDLRGLEDGEQEREEEEVSETILGGTTDTTATTTGSSVLNTPAIEKRVPSLPAASGRSSSSTVTTGGRHSGLNTPTVEMPPTLFPPPPSKANRGDSRRRK